jgi:hypothetical protein
MSLPSGIYTFTNIQSNTTVRSYMKSETIFVSSTMEAPGPFELVRIASICVEIMLFYYVLVLPFQWEVTEAAAVRQITPCFL